VCAGTLGKKQNRPPGTQLLPGSLRLGSMAHPFDQLAKKIGLRALSPSGPTARLSSTG
jgi:hypothetical protein